MFERTVDLTVEAAYSKIKEALVAHGGKVTFEEPPTRLEAKQGSLWGITPQSAKKNIKITLNPQGTSTQVSCQTKLASDWVNITLVGCVLAAVLAAICVWLAVDLGGFLANQVPSFWSGLIAAGGNVNAAAGRMLVNLAWGLAGFLFVTILAEFGVVVYVRSKIDAVARGILGVAR